MKIRSYALLAIAFLVPVFVIATPLIPSDPGTVNALSTTAEDCFPRDDGRNAFMICNMDTAIDIRYLLIKKDDTTTVVTTTTGIELKPGMCDSYPLGGEVVFKGRVSCVAESGTPNVNTVAY